MAGPSALAGLKHAPPAPFISKPELIIPMKQVIAIKNGDIWGLNNFAWLLSAAAECIININKKSIATSITKNYPSTFSPKLGPPTCPAVKFGSF